MSESGSTEDETARLPVENEEDEIQQYMKSPAAESCLFMDYGRQQVMQAIKKLLRQKTVITGIEIAKICESIDEETNDGRATTTDTERIETVAITEKLIIETGHAKPEQTETDVEKIEKGNAKDS